MDPWRSAYTLLKMLWKRKKSPAEMARLPKSALQSGPKSLYSSFPITYVDVWTYNIRRHLLASRLPQGLDPMRRLSAPVEVYLLAIVYRDALVTGSRFLCIRETLRRRFERLGRLLRYFFKSPSGKCWKYKENTAGNFKASKQNVKANLRKYTKYAKIQRKYQ